MHRTALIFLFNFCQGQFSLNSFSSPLSFFAYDQLLSHLKAGGGGESLLKYWFESYYYSIRYIEFTSPLSDLISRELKTPCYAALN